jgi:hypothetical protein
MTILVHLKYVLVAFLRTCSIDVCSRKNLTALLIDVVTGTQVFELETSKFNVIGFHYSYRISFDIMTGIQMNCIFYNKRKQTKKKKKKNRKRKTEHISIFACLFSILIVRVYDWIHTRDLLEILSFKESREQITCDTEHEMHRLCFDDGTR